MCTEEIQQMATIADGIIIGGAGGAIAGLMLWLVQFAHEKVTFIIESNRIHKWLKENTKDEPSNQFRSTRAIASWNNLTEDRVRYLCSIDKRIFLSTGEKENIWGIHSRKPKSNINIG